MFDETQPQLTRRDSTAAQALLDAAVMRTLATLAVLAMVGSPALADEPTTIRATTARSGVSRGFPVASRAVDDIRVEVVDVGTDGGNHPLRVDLDDHTYWTAAQTMDEVKSACRAGKCVTTAITRESIDESNGIAWIRFAVVNEVDHNDPDGTDHDFTTHTTAVMGCKLPHDKAAPQCAWFQPEALESSHVDISGTTLTVTSSTGTVETVELSFG